MENPMPKVTVSLYGRDYQLACAAGQEQRVKQMAAFVEQKMRAVASSVGNTTEPRLFMLACMMMADEIMELRDSGRKVPVDDEETLLKAVAQMHERVAHLAAEVGRAA
jgi:cell division protein ZapA